MGKALCERPFALHREQPEKYKQNVDVSPPSGKISADTNETGAWGHSNEVCQLLLYAILQNGVSAS